MELYIMKLQQLRYVWEVAHHNLNVSATAQSLYTSQPGISKQIRLLEDELGVEVFTRSGKHFTQITPAGTKIIEKAGEVLRMVDSIKQVSQEFCNQNKGKIVISTTYVHARYKLPSVIKKFTSKYPDVALHMYQGSSEEVIGMMINNNTDLAITADSTILQPHGELLMIPCYQWRYSIIVPHGHALTKLSRKITLSDLEKHPLVTYVQGGSGRLHVDNVFARAGYQPHIVFTAADADVIKTYVNLGLGVGIIAQMAYNEKQDKNLVCIDASHIIASGTAQICIRAGGFFRGFVFDFIEMCTGVLDRKMIETIMNCHHQDEIDEIFKGISLPEF